MENRGLTHLNVTTTFENRSETYRPPRRVSERMSCEESESFFQILQLDHILDNITQPLDSSTISELKNLFQLKSFSMLLISHSKEAVIILVWHSNKLAVLAQLILLLLCLLLYYTVD